MPAPFTADELRELNQQRTPGRWSGYMESWDEEAQMLLTRHDLSYRRKDPMICGVWAVEADAPICIDSNIPDTTLIGMLPEIIDWALETHDELVRLREEVNTTAKDLSTGF